MAQWVDLKPDRRLLDSEFEGYRLSLDKLECSGKQLNKELEILNLPVNQYSLQHVKTFTSHNHLCRDRWNEDILYYVSNDLSVFSLCDSKEGGEWPVEVFQVDDDLSMSHGDTAGEDKYNPTLTFPSPTLAVLSNGQGHIALLDTSSRELQLPWKTLYVEKKTHAVVLYDSVLLRTSSGDTPSDSDTQQQVLVITGHVEENETKKFSTVISRIVLQSDGVGEWTEASSDTYNTQDVEYVSVGSSGCIYIASRSYTYCDEIPEQQEEDETAGENAETKPRYIWLQGDDDITLTFALSENTCKSDIRVAFSPQALIVSVKDKQILSGQLYRPIAPGECTWTISGGDNKRLEVYVSKQEPSWWTEFIPGDNQGEMITDPDVAERIHQNLEYLTSDVMEEGTGHNSVNNQQLEECDMLVSDATYLCKIPNSSRKAEHIVNLTGCQWLFNMPPVENSAALFCTRHDVDGLVWAPNDSNELTTTSYKHEATFNALGYVQASKEKRRFICAPSDFSYVAIADTDRHVYVYRQPSPVDTDLRNRKTGRRTQQKSIQQLVSLDNSDTIHGLATTRNAVYVLTKSNIYRYKV